MRNFNVFLCPSDFGRQPDTDAVFDEKLVPGDTIAKYYRASLKVNHGYNYLYFSPVAMGRFGWEVYPRSASLVSDPRMLLFADSVYERSPSGHPSGGGSYVVIPPCRFAVSDGAIVDTFRLPAGARVFAASEGWVLGEPPTALRYGLAWPWHSGRINIARAGGGAVSLSPEQLAGGCDVKERWAGLIRDDGRYLWNGE
jgi:hypothetical protein